MPALLSVNINKYALLRNSRGHDAPNLIDSARACLGAGAHGITVHPRLDERHTRRGDVPALAAFLYGEAGAVAGHGRGPGVGPGPGGRPEYNVECEDHPSLIDLVCAVRPDQCTLVPVRPGEVTSDHGWRFPEDSERLKPVISRLRAEGIRVSVFIDTDAGPAEMDAAKAAGADRVELYTGPYAWAWGREAQAAETEKVWRAAAAAVGAGLGVNAGHDLDRHNLAGIRDIPGFCEVSIGHAQICRALEVGTAASVRELLVALGHGA